MNFVRAANFDGKLLRRGLVPLTRFEPRTLQVNVAKLSDQACHHCRIYAGPKPAERMSARTAARYRRDSESALIIKGAAPNG